MTAIGNQRSNVVVYSDPSSIECHRVRLVLAEKEISSEIVDVLPGEVNDELREFNPQGVLPAIVDRDLALYGSRVIIDYLDERYPHPPFMPVDPVSRARTRLALYRIESDWYSLLPGMQSHDFSDEEAVSRLAESVADANSVFSALPFFFSEEYSILDATLAPLLWRCSSYGIDLSEKAPAAAQYASRMFARPGFEASLSDIEKDMRV